MIAKPLYLDLDLDYFVLPIQREAVDNQRLYAKESCEVRLVEPLFTMLKEKGICLGENIHCFTNHKKSYTYWWMDKKHNATLIHIDAHSDLYRNANRDLCQLDNGNIECYNYLWYALKDNYIDEIYWVIPETLKELIDVEKGKNIIHKSMVECIEVKDHILQIQMNCKTIGNIEKILQLKICTIEYLPIFTKTCHRVTIATSPEFYGQQGDTMLADLEKNRIISPAMANNLYKQHQRML